MSSFYKILNINYGINNDNYDYYSKGKLNNHSIYQHFSVRFMRHDEYIAYSTIKFRNYQFSNNFI